jgi:hypothetical protein
MAIRSATDTTGTIYSSQSELDWASKHLLSCFLILGLTEVDMETYTIDELIDRCEWMFNPHPTVPHVTVGGKERWSDSGFAFGRKQKTWLMMLTRRFWRRHHVSSHEVANNV